MSTTGDVASEPLHIAFLPWLAAGHITPFFDLAVRISLLNTDTVRVSFLSTPPNLLRLPQRPLPPNLRLVPLTPSVDSPVSSTSDLTESTEHLRLLLRDSFDSLALPLTSFLSANRVHWLVHDYSAYWAPRIAKSLFIKTCFLSIFFSCAVSFLGTTDELLAASSMRDITVRPDWVPFETSVLLRPYEAHGIPPRVDETGSVSESHRFGITLRDCDVVAFRTSYELETEWLRVAEDLHGKPVLPVGHCPPKDVSFVGPDLSTFSTVMGWLDGQAQNSVVYVAFGSEARLTKEHIQEIALGLEMSNLPFIWALMGPNGVDEGFLGRTQAQGVVCRGWVPQIKILGHPAVGGFVTHCGCSSIMEGLQFGLALILVPMIYDQMLNARMLEEKMIGREVPRNGENGAFYGAQIGETLRLVMVEEEGKIYRDTCQKFKKVVRNEELQDSYVEKFVEYLRNNCK